MPTRSNEDPGAPPPPADDETAAPRRGATNGTRTAEAPRARVGAGLSRLAKADAAVRPQLNGRAMLAGPTGAGKTWTALSMAEVLDPVLKPLVIDTERESASTYADVFTRWEPWTDGRGNVSTSFRHLRWTPPFDPTELTEVLLAIEEGEFGVVIVDSFTHFWRGQGGTLDIAGSRIQGWKEARPIQEALVDSVLTVPTHVLLCVRSKMGYLISDNGRNVEQVGMEPIQDEQLMYEMNVAFDIDRGHRLTVVKSRTPAVPVGRMYPAGSEQKAAEDYREWLAGGEPPASRADVETITQWFAQISDKVRRQELKATFVEDFGQPAALSASKVRDALEWIAARNDDEPPAHVVEASPDQPAGAIPADSPDEGAGSQLVTSSPAGEDEGEADRRTSWANYLGTLAPAQLQEVAGKLDGDRVWPKGKGPLTAALVRDVMGHPRFWPPSSAQITGDSEAGLSQDGNGQ